ncbi:DUF4179 domain-containing protein [Bacillus sp. FJAT-29790]|uniref:DUF4179 domain-containing protein n=1 Tax=Bacillus sp. FJAT-29790 TaxID=1895002 RepID=UPI001C21E44B|nr:DUF4179 domain-containing protein [Bacillus sp. FJAT-29790]MBU8881245.1 DUF4179 domain-containing protein [Bacillus sp. FJAT-29790]
MSQLDKQQRYMELLESVPMEKLQSGAQLTAYKRLKKQRTRHKRLLQATIAAAIIMIALIGSIRVSPALAHAVAQIPGLKPLVEMISLDKGIEDILINEYYEQINASQTIYGKTLTITGVIADESGMIISYKLNSDEDLTIFKGVKAEVKQNDELVNSTVGSSWTALPEGTYEVENTIDVVASQGMDYSSQDFALILSLRDRPETVFKIPFMLKNEIKASKRFPINKRLIIDGQRFTIHELIISPIRSELKMSIDPSNSKKILSFEDIRIYDEQNEEWGKIRNGFVGLGNYEDEQFSIMLESNYFRIPESITIELREIEAIDKADEFIVIDFENKKIISQPANINIELEIKDNLEIQYKVSPYKKNEHKGLFSNFIDANSEVYNSYSIWISERENHMLIGQLFEVENAERPPVNPVKLKVSRYEQYLNGIGSIQVELK